MKCSREGKCTEERKCYKSNDQEEFKIGKKACEGEVCPLGISNYCESGSCNRLYDKIAVCTKRLAGIIINYYESYPRNLYAYAICKEDMDCR
jgi:hypothetical protein